MATPLPPFGIRGLRPAIEPYSVLQVDEAQYASTIRTDPVATLSYIDEDDGEKVTIGSSMELRQRLDDPVPRNSPLVHCYNATNQRNEGRYIHLFDIKNSCRARTVWTEHHASYAKRSDQSTENPRSNDRNHAAVNKTLAQDKSAAQNRDQGSSIGKEQETRHPTAHDPSQPPVTTVLSEAIPDLVENLAALLETTSNTLRKAAQKTRESNTSPIEDVLSGMSNIVTEIGIFGSSLLETVSKDTTSVKPNQEVEAPSIESSAALRGLEDDFDDVSSVSALNGEDNTSFVPLKHQAEAISPRDSSEERSDICAFCKGFHLECRKSRNSTSACTNCVTLGQPCSKVPLPVNPFLDPPQEHSAPDQHAFPPQKSSSILDQDTEDADFSRRYPPLLTLRRANTVAGLRQSATTADVSERSHPDLGRHNSWAARFPHRPVPQVLDEETQRRRDFARLCFPAQVYTPGLGTKEIKVPRPSSSKATKMTPHPDSTMDPVRLFNFMTAAAAKSPIMSNEHDPIAAYWAEAPKKILELTTARKTLQNGDTLQPQLPGAWPRNEEKQAHSNVSSAESLEESSGAFFHRMMRDHPSQRRDHKVGTTRRLVRHKSLAAKRSDQSPVSGLARSSTVNNVANPASRLNRPFDPLYPLFASVTKPPVQRDAQDTNGIINPFIPTTSNTEQKSVREETTAQLASHQSASSQRLSTLQRPFSPVWEDHLDESKPNKHRLDHKGESSSMYSPPPRHMKSMPNFPSFYRTVDETTPSTLPKSQAAVDLSTEIRQLRARMPPLTVGAEILEPRRDPVPLPQTPFYPKIESATTMPTPPPPPVFANPLKRPPHPLRDIEPESVPQPFLPAAESCLDQLLQMGFGTDDKNLKDRLPIYAAAANGDIVTAVEMIEEDQQANFNQTVFDQLRARGEWEDGDDRRDHDDEGRDMDMEWAST